MILINLLPHREAARKRRELRFNIILGASAMVGVALGAAVYLFYQAAITDQTNANAAVTAEIKKLESQIAAIGGLEGEIAALKARQQAVEDLQSDRNLPVHLLTELINQLPDGVMISKMAQSDQVVTLNGTAQSNERVSELLRNLSNNTPWFSKPELVEIVAGSMALSAREQRRVSNFVIRVRMVRASEVQKAASPVAPASAAAGSTNG